MATESGYSEPWNFVKLAVFIASLATILLGELWLGLAGLLLVALGSWSPPAWPGAQQGRAERHKIPYVSTISEPEFT